MDNYCTIYLVRHGETEWNTRKLMQGHQDSPLTKNGIEKARETGIKLKDINFDKIFSSDLGRAKNTAEIIKLERKLAIKTSKLLRERDYGIYSGREYAIFNSELKKYLDLFETLPHEQKLKFKFPTMESDEEVIQRFIRFTREVSISNPNKTVLIVTHAGVIGNFLIHLGIIDYSQQNKIKIGNSGFIKLISDGIDFIIKESSEIDIKIPLERA